MPWKKQDVESHIKGLDDKQQAAWVKIANSTLSSCLADGGNQKDCEGKALRVANAMAKEVRESMGELTEIGKTISAATAAKLQAARDAIDELLAMAEAEPPTLEAALGEAVTKTEGGESFPAGDYAYVPDPEKSSTWKLRLTKTPGGGPDSGIVGAACAALGPGFRGQKVEIPTADMAAVKAKVRAAWKKANPDKKPADMPEAIMESEGSMPLAEEHIELIERAIGDDGLACIRLIAPGWGTSGYYSPQLLERDGPKVFRQGLHMHLDHQTAAEVKARPEGSTKDLAGVLASDARWEPNGPVGPGLYADAKVFEPYRPLLNEMAPHIGVSIRANGDAIYGEAEGRKGKIIEAITAANTTDYVTRAGAGGVMVPLAESGISDGIEFHIFEAKQNKQEVEIMDAEELKALQEAKAAVEAENARLKERLLLREAQDVVVAALSKVDMPDLTRARLAKNLANDPPVNEGKLDIDTLETAIQEAVKSELEYIAGVSGAGKVKGMGASGVATSDALKESFKNLYLRQGKTSEEAEQLAVSAARGR